MAGLLVLVVLPVAAKAQKDNGIHVGTPKVYDSRELTLMMDNLSLQLQNKNFVDAKALAAALGNIQGYQSSDFSLSALGNLAVGSQAASVFAGTGAGSSAAPTSAASTSTTPTVTINVAPTLNAGTGPTASTAASTSSATPLGPQPPALPTLQTPPTYTPTFGSNGSDLLSDEVNLTYQLYNVRMLLDRSLTDRLHGDESRLHAVVGLDIDLEPDKYAKDAAAIVEITAQMSSSSSAASMPTSAGRTCETDGKLSLVALMPEEGSHNAATLSQKAIGFGGAIASSVFSFGVAGQKRSQVFYLYRDMDTVSFENPATESTPLKFGWQFRPVLGRKSVDPGMRHMMVVLGLPCSDSGPENHQIKMHVVTRWERYDWKTQTTSHKGHWWQHSLPDKVESDSADTEVPSTESSQSRLAPRISRVEWVPTDTNNGVAIVTGDNLFLGTTVRLGTKTFSNAIDGLTLKSDKELEVVAPLSAVAVGGVVSGRYGQAIALESPAATAPSAGFNIIALRLYPLGNDLYQVIADLEIDKDNAGNNVSVHDLNAKLNPPIALVNSAPLPVRPTLSGGPPKETIIRATTMVPAELVNKMASFGIVFPFAGPNWSSSMPYYQTSLKVTRLGGTKSARLLISATNPTVLLCDGWTLQLEKDVPADGTLNCVNKTTKKEVSFDYPAKDLKAYHHFALVKANEQPLIGDIPKPEPPPPGPSLDKDQKLSVVQHDVHPVKFTGKHLDEVTKVLFDKVELRVVKQEDKEIVISLSPEVTNKVRDDVGLQLLSEGNDPVIATLSVVPPKAAPAKKGK
jgi:hypothetical protein